MFQLEEGKTYTTLVTVKNTSTKAGAPVAATLSIWMAAASPGYQYLPLTAETMSFGAGEVRALSRDLYIPTGRGGDQGEVTAWVVAPTGGTIAEGREGFAVAPPALAPVPTNPDKVVNFILESLTLPGSLSYDASKGGIFQRTARVYYTDGTSDPYWTLPPMNLGPVRVEWWAGEWHAVPGTPQTIEELQAMGLNIQW